VSKEFFEKIDDR